MVRKNKHTIKKLIAASLAAVLLLLPVVHSVTQVRAVTESELRQQSNDLQAQINANEEVIHSLEHQSKTLKDKMAQLSAEIERANNEIALTQVKIDQLQIQLDKAQAELTKQKKILGESLKALYKNGDVKTIELLASSDSFSDFINEEEYLERLKVGIQDSADKIESLKKQIETEQAAQKELLASQEAQRRVLKSKEEEQANLLAQTQGEEARYREVVSGLQEQLAAAEKQLQSMISNRNFVNLGSVSRGDMVGRVGSTGFSTGPHIHFAVLNGSNFVNPVSGGNTLAYGFTWPAPNSDWGDVSQGFGCVAPYDWYATKCANGKSMHTGLDIGGWYGDPIVAAASGTIVFRGWMGGYGNTVVIDHGGGLYTYYPHMLD